MILNLPILEPLMEKMGEKNYFYVEVDEYKISPSLVRYRKEGINLSLLWGKLAQVVGIDFTL